MPTTSHTEKHFMTVAAVRDIVIGMSDGLTVPFALAAGLTGAVAANATGSSSPQGSLKSPPAQSPWASAAISRQKQTPSITNPKKPARSRDEEIPDQENRIAKVFRDYGLSDEQMQPVVKVFARTTSAGSIS